MGRSNSLKTCAMLLVLVGSILAQEGEFCFDLNCCAGQLESTLLSDWYDCSVYYICSGSIPYNYTCPVGADFYNPVSRLCETEAPDGCEGGTRGPPDPTTETVPTTVVTSTTGSPINGNCTGDGAYFVPYPGDCKKYMICSGGTLLPAIQECPVGTLFDPEMQECNLEALVECKPVCPDMETINLPHDKDCSLYWLCSLGEASLRSCPPGLIFDSSLATCNLEQAVFCPNLCPTDGTVNLPHSQNCSLYWLCISGDPTLRTCPEDLIFDPILKRCNLETEVDCSTST